MARWTPKLPMAKLQRILPEAPQVLAEAGGRLPIKFAQAVEVVQCPDTFNPSAQGDFAFTHSFSWDGRQLSKGPAYSYDTTMNVVRSPYERTVEVAKGTRVWVVTYDGQWGGYWSRVLVFVHAEDYRRLATDGFEDGERSRKLEAQRGLKTVREYIRPAPRAAPALLARVQPKEASVIANGSIVRMRSGSQGWVKARVVSYYDVTPAVGGYITGAGHPGYEVLVLEGKHTGETLRVPANYVEYQGPPLSEAEFTRRFGAPKLSPSLTIVNYGKLTHITVTHMAQGVGPSTVAVGVAVAKGATEVIPIHGPVRVSNSGGHPIWWRMSALKQLELYDRPMGDGWSRLAPGEKATLGGE